MMRIGSHGKGVGGGKGGRRCMSCNYLSRTQSTFVVVLGVDCYDGGFGQCFHLGFDVDYLLERRMDTSRTILCVSSVKQQLLL